MFYIHTFQIIASFLGASSFSSKDAFQVRLRHARSPLLPLASESDEFQILKSPSNVEHVVISTL